MSMVTVQQDPALEQRMAPAEQHHLWRVDRDPRVHGATIPHGNLTRSNGQDLHPCLLGRYPTVGCPNDA
jgi:hypothetical protein